MNRQTLKVAPVDSIQSISVVSNDINLKISNNNGVNSQGESGMFLDNKLARSRCTTGSSSLLTKSDNIEREGGISAAATLINFLKGMVGPGCLSLPLAFKQAGLWTAFVMVILFGFLNTFCMLQLVHCSQKLSRKKGDTYMDYGTLAYESCAHSFQFFKKYKHLARIIVNVSIVLLQIGISSVFYVFVAEHIKEIFDTLTNFQFSKETWILLIFIPMVLINFMRTLHVISIISSIGNILAICAFFFVIQYLLRAPHNWSKLPWITDFKGVMAACGSILYSFEGQAMVLPLENKLKHPHKMIGPFGVLSTGMTIVTMIYVTSGITGYVTYGEEVRGSITLNLPDKTEFFVVRILWMLVIYFSFVIQQYVIVEMIWPKIKKLLDFDDTAADSSLDEKLPNISRSKNSKKSQLKQWLKLPVELIFRTFLVLITMIIALEVQNLDNIISLVGVTAGMMLAFIIPSTIDTILFMPAYMEETNGTLNRKAVFLLIQNCFLCSIGILGMVFGLKSNLEILLKSQNN